MNVEDVVREWLRIEASPRAPERLLDTTLERVAVTPQDRLPWGKGATRLRRRSLRPYFVLAAAALVCASLVAALAFAGAQDRPPEPVANGWVAYAASQADGTGDIHIVREDEVARRIIGSDADGLDERCPAFSPDGTRLAYGRAQGSDHDERGRMALRPYTGATLVIAELDALGDPTTSLEITVGDGFLPPCPLWSPDGQMIAFAPGRSFPGTTADGPYIIHASSEVWIVRLADQHITSLPDNPVTDLDWSPDSRRLAIARGDENRSANLPVGEILVYTVDSDESRSLPGTLGASRIAWSPDGLRMAYEGPRDRRAALVVRELAGGGERTLATFDPSGHGIGPVWSPSGDRIVYQRLCESQWDGSPCREASDAVVLTVGAGSDWLASAVTEMVMPRSFLQGETEVGIQPGRASWSPDGSSLLYVGGPGLVVVPVMADASPTVLVEDDTLDAEDGRFEVPLQRWGRRPEP
jgi:Tol biopolymer transport system component